MTKQYLSAFLITIALIFLGIWVDISGYTDVFVNPQITDSTQEVAHYTCYIGRITMAIVFLCVPLRFEKLGYTAIALMGGCMIFGSLLYSLGFYQSLFPAITVCAVGSFFVGVGHIWAASTGYYHLVLSYSRREVFLAIIAAQIGERLLMELLNLIWKGSELIAISYTLPLLVVALFIAASHTVPRRSLMRSNPVTGVASRYFWGLCVMAGVGLVASGAMSSVGIWGNAGGAQFQGEAATLPAVIFECIVVVGLCYATFLFCEQKPLALRYQTSLLILVTAFVLSLSQNTFSILPNSLTTELLISVENYAHILFWVVAIDAAFSTQQGTYRIFGIGILACSVAGLLWSIFYEQQLTAAESSVLVVFYLLVVGCIVYPQALNRNASRTSKNEEDINAFALSGEHRTTPGVNGEALLFALQERCTYLEQQFKLSPREGEVLFLTVKGITRKAICSTLCLSEGTVKTHLAHIYEKMNIHSQAELLDIVYKNETPKTSLQ